MAENAVVGALRVFLGLDSAEFETGLKTANDNAKSWSAKIQKGLGKGLDELDGHFKGVASGAGVLGDALAGLGIAGAAAGAALAAAFVGARDAMAFGDEIADTANKLAVTTDYLQEMRLVAHDLGGEFKDADAALEGFTKTFGLATSGLSAKAVKPFTALGLDPKSFSSVQAALDAVIAKISGLGDAAQQAALADKLGLTPLLPAIREGGAAIDDVRKKAHDLGYVMDADLIAKAGEANDKFEDLQAVLDVQFKSAMVEAIPLVMTLTDWMTKGAKAAVVLAEGLKKAGEVGAAIGNLDPFARADADEARRYEADRAQRFKDAKSDPLQRDAKTRASTISSLIAPPKSAPSTTLGDLGNGGGESAAKKARQRADASAEAIYQAERQELAARIALTGDIAKLAALRAKEVDDAAARDADRLARDGAEGKITKAAAAIAAGKLAEAATAQKALITRDAEQQLAEAALKREQDAAQVREQIAGIEAAMAETAAQRGAIEARTLSERQAVERRALNLDLATQLSKGQISEAAAVEAKTAQARLHAAQQTKQFEDGRIAVAQEQARIDQSALQNEIDLLSAAADRAQTGIERRAIEERILDLQNDLERAQLKEIINVEGASSAAGQIAQARLDILDKLKPTEEERAANRVRGAYDDLSGALDDMRQGFENNDWDKALGGLFSAVRQMQAALGKGATTFDKIGAAAGLAQGLGGIVGGTGGSVLGGIGGGAAMGAQIGSVVPGIGTAIGAGVGAIIGGLGSLFGSSKAKKKAKAEAAAQAAADAAAKALAVANERRAQEIALLEAQGKSEEAEAERRKDALAAMDESNRARQEEIWALEDAAKKAEARAGIQSKIDALTLSDAELLANKRAAERAAAVAADPALGELVDQMHALEDAATAAAKAADDKAAADALAARASEMRADIQARIDALTLSDAQQLANKRAAERAAAVAADPALGALIDRLYGLEDAASAAADAAEQQRVAAEAQAEALAKAQQDQRDAADAYEQAVQKAQQDLMEAYRREAGARQEVIDKYTDFAKTLRAYQLDLSAGRGGADAAAAYGGELDRIAALMRLGNADAYGQFQDVAERFLSSSQDSASTLEEYLQAQDKVARIAREGEETALRTVDVAEQQLDMLKAQVSGLVAIDDSVMSVAQAIAALQAALVGGPAGQGGATGAGAGNTFDSSLSSLTIDGERIAYNDPRYADALKASLDTQAAKTADQIAAEYAAALAEGQKWADSIWGPDSGFDPSNVFSALTVPSYSAPDSLSALRAPSDPGMADGASSDMLAVLSSIDKRMANVEAASQKTSVAAESQRSLLANLSDGGLALRTTAQDAA